MFHRCQFIASRFLIRSFQRFVLKLVPCSCKHSPSINLIPNECQPVHRFYSFNVNLKFCVCFNPFNSISNLRSQSILRYKPSFHSSFVPSLTPIPSQLVLILSKLKTYVPTKRHITNLFFIPVFSQVLGSAHPLHKIQSFVTFHFQIF